MEQFKKMNTTENQLEMAIQTVIHDTKCSRKQALAQLLNFGCQHGDIENFKDIVNFFLKHQHKKGE